MERASLPRSTTDPQSLKVLQSEVRKSIPPVALALGGLYLAFSVSDLLLFPAPISTSLAAAAAVTAAVLFGTYLWTRRTPVRLEWAEPAAVFIAILALANSLLQIYLTQDPKQTTNLIFVILAAGLWILTDAWLAVVIGATLFGWVLLIRFLPPLDGWMHFGISLILATLIAVLLHPVRIQIIKNMESLRQQDARRKAELEEVLISTEKAQRSLATSMAVGQRITSILDLDVLLNQVADLIKVQFNCYFVGIFLLDESGDYTILRAATGPAGRALVQDGLNIKTGEKGLVGWVAGKKRPASITDVSQDTRYLLLEALPRTRSELALPLEAARNLLGVLDMHSEHIAAFQEDDIPYLQLLSDQVAVAIQNASLYQVEKSRRRFAETLYDVGKALSGTLNLEDILHLILEQLKEIVHFDRGSVMMRAGEELEIAAATGFPLGSEKMHVSIKENDVFFDIYHTKKPLHLSNVSLRPDWQHAAGLPKAQAWLGIPLIRTENSHSEDVIGMLSLTRETLEAFSEDEVTLATTFAGQAAVALQNARLYDQIKRFNQDLEAMVHERTRALQDAYDQLARLDRTKSDFIGIASHELRTPITVLQGYSQMLLDDPVIQQNNLHKMMVQNILGGSHRLNEIVGSLLDAAKVDSQALRLNPGPVVVSSLVEFVVSGLEDAISDRHQRVILDALSNLPAIHADIDAMRKVFYHLIVNAIKYTPDGGRITVSGRVLSREQDQPDTDAVEVVVSDTGIGIDPTLQELIFEKFYQTGEIALHSSGKFKFKGGGPGLGLAIARGIIDAHGGRIWVESPGHDEKNCPGSRFHVVVPLK